MIPYRWLLYLSLAASAVGGYTLWAKHERNLGAEPYIKAIATQKAEASQLLKTETAKSEATTKQLTLALAVQEKTDAEHKQTSDQLGARLRRLAADSAGRLRDPAGCGASSDSPSGQAIPGPQDSTEYTSKNGRLLSKPISELFVRLTRESDEINDAYISCRADSLSLRMSLPAQLEGLKN